MVSFLEHRNVLILLFFVVLPILNEKCMNVKDPSNTLLVVQQLQEKLFSLANEIKLTFYQTTLSVLFKHFLDVDYVCGRNVLAFYSRLSSAYMNAIAKYLHNHLPLVSSLGLFPIQDALQLVTILLPGYFQGRNWPFCLLND